MYCPSCGNDVTDKKFCNVCGRPVVQKSGENKSGAAAVPTQPSFEVKTNRQKSSSKGLIVTICILVVLLIVVSCVQLFGLIRNPDSDADSRDVVKKEYRKEIKEEPDEEETPEQPEFLRESTYDSGYTYTNMEEIHSSEEAEDEEAFEMQELVTDFNNAWVEYINSGDETVFSYLREDTQAYEYAVAFGDKDICEEYILMEVNDVRQYENCYYVWTHEIIEKTSMDSSDVEQVEYHWIYKISQSSGGYYIENYISDPAYK